jgi:hypothetical protein
MKSDSKKSRAPRILYIRRALIKVQVSGFKVQGLLSKKFLDSVHIGVMTEGHYDISGLDLGAA